MHLWPRHTGSIVMRVTAAVAAVVIFAAAAEAGPREQAKRMHDRIAGVPPSDTVLNAMEADIAAGRTQQAALRAMDDPAFYSVTLKNLVTPWTNREQTVFAPLNDYTATVIGMGLAAWMQGRAFRMNAVAVFVALLFFGWLWGGWGLLVGVPLLATVKTTLERIPSLERFAALLNDNERPVAPAEDKKT